MQKNKLKNLIKNISKNKYLNLSLKYYTKFIKKKYFLFYSLKHKSEIIYLKRSFNFKILKSFNKTVIVLSNGKLFNFFLVRPEYIGQKAGNFLVTKKFAKYKIEKKKKRR